MVRILLERRAVLIVENLALRSNVSARNRPLGPYWQYHVAESTANLVRPDVRADLVEYLQVGITNEQMNSVWDTVLSDPDPRGGHMPLAGIASLTRVTAADGHEAIAVALRRTASKEAVATIRSRLDRCEHVYRVLESVVPKEIEHLE